MESTVTSAKILKQNLFGHTPGVGLMLALEQQGKGTFLTRQDTTSYNSWVDPHNKSASHCCFVFLKMNLQNFQCGIGPCGDSASSHFPLIKRFHSLVIFKSETLNRADLRRVCTFTTVHWAAPLYELYSETYMKQIRNCFFTKCSLLSFNIITLEASNKVIF